MKRVIAEEEPFGKFLFYGLPGSGKTRLAGTAALDDRSWPALWVDIAGNPMSIRDYTRQPDIIRIEGLAECNPIYNWLAQGQDPNHVFAQSMGLGQNGPYKTVVIDQLTELQRLSFNLQTGSDNVGPGSFPNRVERQHFGNVLAQMVRFANLFYALPMHVIINVQEKMDKDEITGSISVRPFLWGQSDTEVGSYAYVVGRLVSRSVISGAALKIMEDVDDNTTSVALFAPSAKYVAKDQYGKLPSYMADPSMSRILDCIFGSQHPVK